MCQPFWWWRQNILGKLDQYHCYWCPGSLPHQIISNYGTDNVGWKGFCLPQGRILGVFSWVQSLRSILTLHLPCEMQYCVITDCVVMRQNWTNNWEDFFLTMYATGVQTGSNSNKTLRYTTSKCYVYSFTERRLKGILHVDGLVQDCSNSSALAMELLQSRSKPSMYHIHHFQMLIQHRQ